MQILTVENILERPAHFAKNNKIAVNCPWINPDGFYVPGFFASISKDYVCIRMAEAWGVGDNGISIPNMIHFDSPRYQIYRDLGRFKVDENSWYSEVQIDLEEKADVSWDSIKNLYILEKSDEKEKYDLAILRFEIYS